MQAAVLDGPMPVQCPTNMVKERILASLNDQAVISLETLIEMLPEYTWNQVFHAVDALARQGKITLRRHQFDYTLFSNSYAA